MIKLRDGAQRGMSRSRMRVPFMMPINLDDEIQDDAMGPDVILSLETESSARWRTKGRRGVYATHSIVLALCDGHPALRSMNNVY